MSEPTKLLVVRHGSTRLNHKSGDSTEVIRGWADPPLDAQGIKEAKALAAELKHISFDVLMCSDLDRAETTAHYIARATDIPITAATRGLRPIEVGDWTGKPIKNCAQLLYNQIAHKPDVPFPNGESFAAFLTRFTNCLAEIHEKYAGKTVCIVCHHRNERTLASLEMGDGKVDPRAYLEKGIEPGGYSRHTLVDDDADDDLSIEDHDEDAAPARRKSAPKQPDYPWTKKPFDTPGRGPDKGLWSVPVGTAGVGKASDPIDLDPDVKTPKTRPT
jgi:broad specificity phosphatase PhoE